MGGEYLSRDIILPSQLSCLAAHPKTSVFACGLITGHVHTYNYSTDTAVEITESVRWQTKRHKGSCRSVAYSADGEYLYSTGTDNLLKVANSLTGKVLSKLTLPLSKDDTPTHLLPLNPSHLLLGTDEGHVHLFDTRSSSATPATTHQVHTSYISSITALPPTTDSTTNLPKSFVTTGDSTLAVLDLRKGVTARTESQDDEILSGCVVKNVGKSKRYTRAYVGMGEGTIHAFERGIWGDMVERIRIAKTDVEVDVLLDISGTEHGMGAMLAAGCGDGVVRIVQLGNNKVVREYEHRGEEGDEEGVTALVVDFEDRLVTGGGESIKLWYQKTEVEEEGADEDNGDEDDEKGSGDEQEDSEDSDDSDRPKKKNADEEGGRKKRKRGKQHMRIPKKRMTDFAGLD